MDGLDVDILRTMGLQPFLRWPHPRENLRPAAIARLLGVSAETVKDRIARLEAEGVIAGYEIFPNFRHLGVTATTYHFRAPDPRRKARGLEDLHNVDGVVGVFDFLGPEVCVDLAWRNPRELERKVDLVARLLDAVSLPHPCFDYAPPEVPRSLANLDWRIVRALRGRARRRPEEVAAEMGVSARTVRRRLERMLDEGSVDVVPVVQTSRLTGFILYEVLVTFEDGSDLADSPRRLAEAFAGALCAAWPLPERERRCATLLLLARSVAEIDALRRKAEEIPGVARVEVLIPTGSATRSEWIDEAIERRIEATSALSKAPVAVPRP